MPDTDLREQIEALARAQIPFPPVGSRVVWSVTPRSFSYAIEALVSPMLAAKDADIDALMVKVVHYAEEAERAEAERDALRREIDGLALLVENYSGGVYRAKRT